MPIQFNTVTWYSKLGAVILFLLVVPVMTFYIGMKYQETTTEIHSVDFSSKNQPALSTSTYNQALQNVLNNTYVIDSKDMHFTNGVSYDEIAPSAPGSAMKTETRIFGQPTFGDLNGDGKQDAIFFVSQETGGTGIFFYVVAAENQGGKYVGLTGVFLGDRISPQNIRIENGVAVVNYATRKDGEPMTAEPSFGLSKYFTIQNGFLTKSTEFNMNQSKVFNASPRNPHVSNVVGFMGYGAFILHVPDWAAEYWKFAPTGDVNEEILTLRNEIKGRDFSDILIRISTSTETFNADTQYTSAIKNKENLIAAEVLLNSTGDIRIYYTERLINGRIYDTFYLDGNGKTAIIRFDADQGNYSTYSPRVREFVEGFEKGGGPRG